MNIAPTLRTLGVRDNGTLTDTREHISRDAARAHVNALQRAGMVPQAFHYLGGVWRPVRADLI